MSRVEIVVGSIVDSDAPLLVVPGDTGGVAAEYRVWVKQLQAQLPSYRMRRGSVAAGGTRDGRTVLLAVLTDRRTPASSVETLRRVAERIGGHAAAANAVVAMPVLTVDAEALDRAAALRLIADGFGAQAHQTAVLQIHVPDDATAAQLRRVLAGLEPHAFYSMAVQDLCTRLASDRAVPAGTLGTDFPDAGPIRTVEDHLSVVRARWSPELVPTIDFEHVVIGLALDPDLGWHLLRASRIHGLVATWLPESPAWDQLSDDGRRLAEDQPLLATALGAPAEWTAELPGPVTVMAFAPQAERLAVLVGDTVHDVGADGRRRVVGRLDGVVLALGWGREDVLALRAVVDGVEVVRVSTGAVAGRIADGQDGRLAAGLPAWVDGPSGVHRWWGPERPPDALVPGGSAVLAVDGPGRRAVVQVGDEALVVSTLTEDRPAGSTDNPATVARFPSPEGPYALVALGRHIALAEVTEDDVLVVAEPGKPPIAAVRTGGVPIDALAANATGHCVAVASGTRVSVWPVARTRPVSRGIAGYDPDSRAGADLLDADRDALALAGLIASGKLTPPLAIGLFGEWGSGKTFVLERIMAALESFQGADGYVREIETVEFNAWHYAETNLWASLVDQVLRRITKSGPEVVAAMPEVEHADREVEAAKAALTRRETELADARTAEQSAKSLRARRRMVVAGMTALTAAAGVVTVVGGFDVWPAILTAAGAVTTAATQVRTAREKTSEVTGAGRTVVGIFDLRAAHAQARAAEAVRQEAELGVSEAEEEAGRRLADQASLRRQAETEPLAALLRQLSTVTEYREQLTLVTRTRELFQRVDAEFVAGQRRVVIAIDDLDRCPAEKVVQVLEAVHLLFGFPMFVVVLAVDTRWLEQSLRIRYHQLMGSAGCATPSDYLEKIIQVPVRLTSLDEAMVRTMITGLTGRFAEAPAEAAVPPPVQVTAAPEVIGTPAAEPEHRLAPSPVHARMSRVRLPARVLDITEREATAMSAVAPLIGTTPRTVKRFVNTYRIIKARTKEPAEFDHIRYGIGDHEVVAFLLAVTTGQPAAASVLAALCVDPPDGTLVGLLSDLEGPVRRWLKENSRYAEAPGHRYAEWAPEVARFSFVALR